ncbi:hypothetical protein SDC9_162270 [bioreactor metagenome]|uniref:Uncharacterized protein n=1 Tax=bioreactor metagenome TaxID=1076179 RepID=A0A645FKM8_9ZZZZ
MDAANIKKNCAAVSGLYAISTKGRQAAQENTEKNRIIIDPSSPRSPKKRSIVYATPANTATLKATSAAIETSPVPDGLITSAAPTNANRMIPHCLHVAFSLRISAEKMIIKIGESSTKTVASDRII